MSFQGLIIIGSNRELATQIVKRQSNYISLINPMKQGHFRKPDSSSKYSRNSAHFMRHTHIHPLVHNSPPLVPTLSQVDSYHTLPFCSLITTSTLYYHVRLGLASGVLPWGFPPKFYTYFPPVRATFPTHLSVLHMSHNYAALHSAAYFSVVLFPSSSVQMFS